MEILELGKKIQAQVKDDMDKRQREYYLRQQLKAIKGAGREGGKGAEVEEYRTKIAKKKLPPEAKKEAERELARLARMHPSSAEYTVATTYLDWLTALPWHKATEDKLDIKKARRILDEDHYGLEKAKRRIIEYLAVRKLKPDSKGPILCFAGPPGTGKTSLGQSIAPRPRPEVHPHLARRRARRGGDPRPPPHLRRARCPAGSSRESGGRSPTTPSSCWTRSTRWARISAAIPRRRCSRSSTRSRISPSRTTTWTSRSTCRM